MPTVAILHYAGPPGIGGVEVTIQHHARLLANDGHHVRIIAGSGSANHTRVEVRLDPLFGSRGRVLERINAQLATGEISDEFRALIKQTREALTVALAGTDVLLIHNILSLHKNLALTAALRELHDQGQLGPIIAWNHDFSWHDPFYIGDMHPGWPWTLLRDPWPGVRYVAVSEDRRSIMADLLGCDPNAITVITPGVDLPGLHKLEADTVALVERHDLLDANPLLLLPARITRRKNIELAIAIVGALREYYPATRLVVTGPPGPHNPTNDAYLAQLEAIQRSSGANNAILFLYRAYADAQGQPLPVSDAMIADLYKLADGLLFPSISEGFGIPILEAGLNGIPIFCSDIAPFRASAGDAALYFDPTGDPHEIAARIAQVLTNDTRLVMRQRVRQQATWQAIYRRTIVPLLDEVLA